MTDEFKRTLTLNMPGLDQHARPGDSIPTRCDALGYYWGIHASQQTGTARQVYMSEISVTRFSDAATPVLMRLCQTGSSLAHVTLTVKTEKDGKTIFEMVYELVNARVFSVRPGGSINGEDPKPIEDLTFEYEKLKMNVTEGETKGSAELTPQNP